MRTERRGGRSWWWPVGAQLCSQISQSIIKLYNFLSVQYKFLWVQLDLLSVQYNFLLVQ